MHRPKPTKRLILQTGYSLVESIHHGLAEVSLKEVYRHLNLEETLAFASASWKLRDQDLRRARGIADQATCVYDLFREIYHGSPVFAIIKSNLSRLSPENVRQYGDYNPFPPTSLQERLESIFPNAFQTLQEGLRQPARTYLFEVDYRKRESTYENNPLVVRMDFQSIYPRKGKVLPAYAAEIARMLRNYPIFYQPFHPHPKVSVEKPDEPKEQLNLF
jgi:hypothetical protein